MTKKSEDKGKTYNWLVWEDLKTIIHLSRLKDIAPGIYQLGLVKAVTIVQMIVLAVRSTAIQGDHLRIHNSVDNSRGRVIVICLRQMQNKQVTVYYVFMYYDCMAHNWYARRVT